MTAIARPSSKAAGAGCLIVFALPFAAAGIGMGVWLAITLLTFLTVRGAGLRRRCALSAPS